MHRVEKGLVLRAVPYRDADMMLTILTECDGKITAAARGVLRKSSRLSAAVQCLAYSEFTLYESGGRFTVNEAEALELFYELRDDLGALSAGSYFAEVLDQAADEEVVNPNLLRLGLNALYALSKKRAPRRLIKAAFELRMAAEAGYAPSLDACCICKNALDCGSFSMQDGSVCCRACGRGGILLSEGVLRAMRYILQSEVARIFAFRLGDEALTQLGKISEDYLTRHFDRAFPTLRFYKSLESPCTSPHGEAQGNIL